MLLPMWKKSCYGSWAHVTMHVSSCDDGEAKDGRGETHARAQWEEKLCDAGGH